MNSTELFEKITSLAKRRGFIYPGSEIYGGLAGTWDYGPLGVELKRNIKNEFWRRMVQERSDVVGIDASIIMHPKVWEASGHLASFSDPLVECKKCHSRFRPDEIGISNPQFLISNETPCPNCGVRGNFTEPKQFNLMVETYLGVVEGEKLKTYLRGEITQGVHVNFKNVLDSTRVKLPFGVAQVGKAFRNEITPGGFTFRSREFEQMELQFYIHPVGNKTQKASVAQSPIERISNGAKPEEIDSMDWFEYWKQERMSWFISLGMRENHLRFKEHAKDELAHYARAAVDIEYGVGDSIETNPDRSVGVEWKEMEGVHHRGDWDVRRHAEYSKVDLTIFDEATKERFLPFIIETSGGVDRAALFFLMDAYREEELTTDPPRLAHSSGEAGNRQPTTGDAGNTRIVLKLHPKLAPYKVAVFPLLANKPELVNIAESIYRDLKKQWMVAWDDRGNIGKRYRAQDEAGTPYCITVDFDSIENKDVTVRDRDTMAQERVKISDLPRYFGSRL
ncbi:MAG: glycine--tRNA ligase [bacterium]|nr:glycine--tRNA ligase [bacterium]